MLRLWVLSCPEDLVSFVRMEGNTWVTRQKGIRGELCPSVPRLHPLARGFKWISGLHCQGFNGGAIHVVSSVMSVCAKLFCKDDFEVTDSNYGIVSDMIAPIPGSEPNVVSVKVRRNLAA